MNTMTMIKLSDLTISPKNVRVVSAKKQEDKELTASIRAKGILQNLVVFPVDELETTFEVIAGGRRFAVLTQLCDNGEIDGDYPVPCSVRCSEEATEISIGENIKADMHPADVFMAFKTLADEGNTEKAIAERLGRTQAEVKRLLKLSTVAPELVGYFRAGKLDLDCIMAFTVCDNQERQLACYVELSRGHINSRRIKHYLLDEAVSSKSREAKFIGTTVYKKAGGTISADLFSDESFWNDTDLLDQLIDEKLTSAAKAFEKIWAWVETSKLGWEATNGFLRIQGEPMAVPKDITDRIAALEDRLSKLDEKEDEWTVADDDAYRKIEEKLDKLTEKRDSFVQFTAEQKAIAGVVITFGSDGDLTIHEGMVRKTDKKRLEQLYSNAPETSGDDSEGNESVSSSERIESNALFSDLEAYYGQAFQAHLLQHDTMCFDLLVYSLAYRTLKHRPCWDSLDNIVAKPQSFDAIGIHETKAAAALKDAELALTATWAEMDCVHERFSAFQALSKKEKMKLMAFCVALSTSAGIGRGKAQQSLVAEQCGFDLGEYWKPTQENYFSRIKRDDLLEIGVSLTNGDFAEQQAKSKKGELVTHIASMPEIDTWLPKIVKA